MNGDHGALLVKQLLAFLALIVWATGAFLPYPLLRFLATPISRQTFWGVLIGLVFGPLLMQRGRVRIIEIAPAQVVTQADAGTRFANLLIWLKVIALGAVSTYLIVPWLPGGHHSAVLAEAAMVLTLLLAGWLLYPSRHDIELPIVSYVPPPGRPTPLPPPPDDPPQAA